jgi:rod shape-determining protein MreC
MRNLFAFFKRFQVFMFFVLLQSIAMTLYFTYMEYPKSEYLTSASNVSGTLLSYRNDISKLFQLSAQNTKLQHENVTLHKKLPHTFIQISKQTYQINDSIFQQRYDYITGEIINSNFDKRNNFFTLNVGKKNGVKRGMGVFSSNGIVGIIQNSSDHFSVVKSVLTENINIDVMEKKSGAFGLLKWDGSHPRYGKITGISNDMQLKKWSTIVTRGGSGIFPKGLKVGKIAKIESVEGKPLWDITILFSEDYRKLQRVYIIKDLMKIEQEKLEQSIPSAKIEDKKL